MLHAHFSRFLEAVPGRLHFAAHSHHPWPDVTEAAQARAWADAALHIDEKWHRIFTEVVPQAQQFIGEELGLPSENLAIAPNTHELVLRLLSCLPERAHVVTSDAEFHSFERQTRRLEEEGLLRVTRVAAEPLATFAERFLAEVRQQKPQLAFVSHVFFNSGYAVEPLESWLTDMPAETWVALDGYHGFCAVPTRLNRVADRLFYLAGGYKYAMAGEGACFMHVPASLALRPRNTGWFASFGALQSSAHEVGYGPAGARFFGATFDPTGLYRFNAAMQFRRDVGLTTEKNRAWAQALQHRFLDGLRSPLIREDQLVVPRAISNRGQFLTFRTPEAQALSAKLSSVGVVTDARQDRLRFGFGVYQREADVDALLNRVNRLS